MRLIPAPARWFLWFVTGALAGLGVVSALTIGPVLVAAAVGLSALLLTLHREVETPILGALLGLAVAPLTIAWLNRQGPGMYCEGTTDAMSCTEMWSPWPFVATASGLVTGAVVLAVVLARRSSLAPATRPAAPGPPATRHR